MSGITWGLGLRAQHFADWHAAEHVPVLELMTDNLIHHKGGPALWHSKKISCRAESTLLHGIGLNIGGVTPLSERYLVGLRDLCNHFNPKIVSDHLCFTQALGVQSYELLPIMRSTYSLEHIGNRIDHVQQFLGRQISLENVSAYVNYIEDKIPEGEFLNLLAEKTGCGILLDVNNIFVTSKNFSLNPVDELNRFNFAAVKQIHIAGHSIRDDYLFDTHDTSVIDEVWSLLKITLKKISEVNPESIPVILENDNSEASLFSLISELKYGQKFLEKKMNSDMHHNN